MMPRTTSYGCSAALFALFLAAFSGVAQAVTLTEALSAYRSNRVSEAEQMLAEVAADPAAPEIDRAQARRTLARIDWMARAETDAAAQAVQATPPGEGYCAVMVGALSVFRESENGAALIDQADAVGSQCQPDDLEALRVERARTRLALANGVSGEARARHLAMAAADLQAIDSVAAITPDVAGARLSLALAERDADAAFAAWRAYYWLSDADAPQALGQYAGRVRQTFADGLRADANDAGVLALLGMLTRAGFTEDARRLAEHTGIADRLSGNPDWRRIDAYFTLDRAVREITLRANREIINGGDASWYGDEIMAATAQAMQAVGLTGDPRVVLPDAFGVYGTVGQTGGYPSMHAGHLVQDERLSVEQYGRSAEVRFIVIDHMLTNGYESWLWDGWAAAGGWSSNDGAIVQIRSVYTNGPISALRRTRPGPQRDAFLADIERRAAAERQALGRDGVAELPATADRLELQAYAAIAARFPSDDAFIAEVWRATNQSSIEAHEGRHELDKIANPNFTSAGLEFRAKLSQIIFADYPRLGLASVAGQPINETAHGQGNRRVLEGYRRWMRAHRSEIQGFDRSQPTLLQLDRLTDEQIVAAARSMDPWAR